MRAHAAAALGSTPAPLPLLPPLPLAAASCCAPLPRAVEVAARSHTSRSCSCQPTSMAASAARASAALAAVCVGEWQRRPGLEAGEEGEACGARAAICMPRPARRRVAIMRLPARSGARVLRAGDAPTLADARNAYWESGGTNSAPCMHAPRAASDCASTGSSAEGSRSFMQLKKRTLAAGWAAA